MKRHKKNKYFANPSYVLCLAHYLNLSLLMITNIDRDSVFENYSHIAYRVFYKLTLYHVYFDIN